MAVNSLRAGQRSDPVHHAPGRNPEFQQLSGCAFVRLGSRFGRLGRLDRGHQPAPVASVDEARTASSPGMPAGTTMREGRSSSSPVAAPPPSPLCRSRRWTDRYSEGSCVRRETVFGTVLEPLHHALSGPNDRAVRQDQFDIDFAVRVLVVGAPLGTRRASYDFSDVRAQREQAPSEICGEKTARARQTRDGVVVEESIDGPQARWAEVGKVPGRRQRPCDPPSRDIKIFHQRRHGDLHTRNTRTT